MIWSVIVAVSFVVYTSAVYAVGEWRGARRILRGTRRIVDGTMAEKEQHETDARVR